MGPKIIPAIDLELSKATELLPKLSNVEDKIFAYKIGSIQALEIGLTEAVRVLREHTKLPIIYDHQKGCTDVPSIVEKQVKLVEACGADMYIAVPPGAGPDSLESFVNACNKYTIEPIVLLEMTHPNANAYLKKGTPRDIFDKIVELDVRYVVAPGNKTEKLAEYKNWIDESGKDIQIMSPGIGAQGGEIESAVKHGTDYPIVGRTIYEAENPADVVKDLYEKAQKGFGER